MDKKLSFSLKINGFGLNYLNIWVVLVIYKLHYGVLFTGSFWKFVVDLNLIWWKGKLVMRWQSRFIMACFWIKIDRNAITSKHRWCKLKVARGIVIQIAANTAFPNPKIHPANSHVNREHYLGSNFSLSIVEAVQNIGNYYKRNVLARRALVSWSPAVHPLLVGTN